jgi:hypothetical protein
MSKKLFMAISLCGLPMFAKKEIVKIELVGHPEVMVLSILPYVGSESTFVQGSLNKSTGITFSNFFPWPRELNLSEPIEIERISKGGELFIGIAGSEKIMHTYNFTQDELNRLGRYNTLVINKNLQPALVTRSHR